MKNEHGKKVNIWADSVFATIFVLVFMFALQKTFEVVNLEGMDAIGQALKDMEITDYAFSEVREDSLAPDPNIVIVNMGPLGRDGIAQQVRIADKYGAKVIGIDSFFKGLNGDTLGSYSLAGAIANAKAEIVMVAKVDQSDSLLEIPEAVDSYDHVYISDSMFLENTHMAIANLDTDAENQDDIKICRAFPPKRTLINGGGTYTAFGARMAELYDSTKIDKLLQRDKEYEIVNFKGDVLLSKKYLDYTTFTLGERIIDDKYMCFEVLDYDQILAEDFAPEMIKDRIVLIGYLGERLGAPQWEDKFFTPLNSKIAGRANPDMYGPVIHANITAMVLDENYVSSFSEITEAVLGILLLFINVFFFSVIYHKMGAWYDGITKLIQLVEIIALTFVVIIVFSNNNFKMELAIAFFGIALVGDLLEIYYGVIKNVFNEKNMKKLLTLGMKSG
jgi:CHASE2 domain-containing sensor protein